MKKFWNEVEKRGGQWMFTFLVAAFALVAPLASHASEFPGMGAAYAQRLEQYRKISSLWLAPQALVPGVPSRRGAVTAGRVSEMKSGVDCCSRNSTSYPDSARYCRFSREFSGLATKRFTPAAERSANARALKA